MAYFHYIANRATTSINMDKVSRIQFPPPVEGDTVSTVKFCLDDGSTLEVELFPEKVEELKGMVGAPTWQAKAGLTDTAAKPSSPQ